MTKIVFIRHGDPDYSFCDSRGFIGLGRELAPLAESGIKQAYQVAQEEVLKGSQIILSSPYTRALHTAAIISKQTGIDLKIEMDLHEMIPDKTLRYHGVEQVHSYHMDFCACKGRYPQGEDRPWETVDEIVGRALPVLLKYLDHQKIIVVTHGGIIRRFVGQEKIGYCVPYVVDFHKDFRCWYWLD